MLFNLVKSMLEKNPSIKKIFRDITILFAINKHQLNYIKFSLFKNGR